MKSELIQALESREDSFNIKELGKIIGTSENTARERTKKEIGSIQEWNEKNKKKYIDKYIKDNYKNASLFSLYRKLGITTEYMYEVITKHLKTKANRHIKNKGTVREFAEQEGLSTASARKILMAIGGGNSNKSETYFDGSVYEYVAAFWNLDDAILATDLRIARFKIEKIKQEMSLEDRIKYKKQYWGE